MTEPTPENIFNALPLVGGRVSVAIDEIIRLIENYLPGAVDYTNAQLHTNIQKPLHIRIAPSTLNDADIDSILIEWRVDKKVSPPGIFTDQGTIIIHSIDERFVVGRHTSHVQDRADLIMGLLYFGLGGWTDPTGRKVWRSLEPQSKTQLPGEWSQYSGTSITYRMTQGNENVWT